MSPQLQWLILLSVAAFVYCWKEKIFQRRRYQDHNLVVTNDASSGGETVHDEGAQDVEIAEHAAASSIANLPAVVSRGETPPDNFKDKTKLLCDQLIIKGAISVLPLHTDLSSSNNCTISSAFLVDQHTTTTSSKGLSNEIMKRIIDEDPVAAGRDIRKRLGLGPNSHLIPSDVFDYCNDKLGILKRNQLVGVTGGDLLNDIDMNEFFALLERADKTGASILHKGNMTTVLKAPQVDGGAVYDFVDTYGYPSSCWTNPNPKGPPCGVRVQCRDLQTLRVAIRWLSIRRYSRKDWDQIFNTDFMADPPDVRTFEAFVWRQA